MPKTKKQAKTNKLFTSISLSSNKGRLIAFLLVFAVIGGGLMLYKSFASSYEYDATSGALVLAGGQLGPAPPVVNDPNTYASKNGTSSVYFKYGGQTAGINSSVVRTTDPKGSIGIIATNSAYTQDRTCAVMRVPSGTATIQMSQISEVAHVYYVAGDTYHEVCSGWETIVRKNLIAPGVMFQNGPPAYLYEVKFEAR